MPLITLNREVSEKFPHGTPKMRKRNYFADFTNLITRTRLSPPRITAREENEPQTHYCHLTYKTCEQILTHHLSIQPSHCTC